MSPDVDTANFIALAVVTFKRPAGLAALLESVSKLQDLAPGWVLSKVIVVDNDVDRSAESTVRAHFPEALYFCESQPGIAAARNRAIDEALAHGMNWVAFIDDDETVTTSWLRELSIASEAEQPVATIGSVQYHRPADTPQWFIGMDVFGDQLVDKTDMGDYFTTNNLLLRIDPAPVEMPLFDLRFGLTGGSDHHLGARLRAAGKPITFAPRALAHEIVLPERIDFTTAVRRLIRNGNVMVRVELALANEYGQKELPVRLRAVAQGLARLVLGTFRAAAGIPNGQKGLGNGFRTMCVGVGQLLAATGGTVEEYQRSETHNDGK